LGVEHPQPLGGPGSISWRSERGEARHLAPAIRRIEGDPGGIDSTSIPDGEGVSDGNEKFTAIGMKGATLTSPVTIATLDFSMVSDGPTPCGVFAQAIISH
jgi:hypothetical protein